MKETMFWVMLGFFFGVIFVATLQGNYERPDKWEDGGIITHQGKWYKLQHVEARDETK